MSAPSDGPLCPLRKESRQASRDCEKQRKADWSEMVNPLFLCNDPGAQAFKTQKNKNQKRLKFCVRDVDKESGNFLLNWYNGEEGDYAD